MTTETARRTKADVACSRCNSDVPPLLGPPPGRLDVWWRNAVTMRRVETVTYVLRFRRFTRRWWPENPHDVLRESYSELTLCDSCAAAVFLFAQGLDLS